MEPIRLRDELLRAAQKLGLPVRLEPFETRPVRPGGLCRVRGRQVVLVDENASPVDQVATLAEALSHFDLDGIYLVPEAREAVEAARRRDPASRGTPGRSKRPRDDARPAHGPKPGVRWARARRRRDGGDHQ